MTPSTQDARATGLVELAERVEAANLGESREWLEQAFYAVNPAPECGTPERTVWAARSFRFHALIEADGFLDAAMSLVPEGWRIWTADFSIEGRFRWMLCGPKLTWIEQEDGSREGGDDWYQAGVAQTPALALTAAALRALAASTKDQNDG